MTHISLNYCAIVIISDYLKEEEEFEKIIMAIVQSSVPEKVTLQELPEETHSHTDLPAIARGYFTTKEKRIPCRQCDPFLRRWLSWKG